jgi:hypothetical protein
MMMQGQGRATVKTHSISYGAEPRGDVLQKDNHEDRFHVHF